MISASSVSNGLAGAGLGAARGAGAGAGAAGWAPGNPDKSPISASKSISDGFTGASTFATGIACRGASALSACDGPFHSTSGAGPRNRSRSAATRWRAASAWSNGSFIRCVGAWWRTGWLNAAFGCSGVGAPSGSSSGSTSSGPGSAAAATGPAAPSSTVKLYSPTRNPSPSVSTTRLSRAVGCAAPLTNTPFVLRSVSTQRSPSTLITQCVLDKCRSGSGRTHPLLSLRPIDSVPLASRRLSPVPASLTIKAMSGPLSQSSRDPAHE